ncbi:MAG TPA: IS200/IS605 family transposase [Ignavibacteriaceae bacterium]|nr:IS200/IS605 family transposase [Ignavibacteriaceae bacterium]
MSLHSYTKLWTHIIWETLSREKLLDEKTGKLVSEYLFNYSKEKNIFMKVNYVNPEHVHTLIDQPTNLSIEDTVKLFKGSSSHFINQQKIVAGKFSWGRGYAAFSVSESQIDKVVEYIKNQKEHHRVKSYIEEYELFMKKYGFGNVVNRGNG